MKSINLLIKPASSLCNLRCRYCFYEDEAQNRIQHSMGVMPESLADTLIERVFSEMDTDGAVSFAFQGGEPTVAGLPFFRHFVKTVRQKKPAGVRVSFAIQTNGTLLNDEWAEFLQQAHFLVGLSVDGFRNVHDTHRVDVSGCGTWKKVVAAKKLLEKHGVEHNALCVVTGQCAEDPEKVYRNLKVLGFRYIQFIACLDPIGHAHGQEPWSLTPERYGQFLCRVFPLWYQDWKSGNYCSVRLFEDFVHILLGDNASTCATCGKCGAYLVVEGDGSVYPCDFFVLDDWKIGNFRDMTVSQMLQSQTALDFLQWGTVKPPECAACPYGKICNGGCKNDWTSGDAAPHNYYCAAFQMLLDSALPQICEIADAERIARQNHFL